MTTNKKVDNKTKAKIYQLHLEGLPSMFISERMNLTRSVVSAIIREEREKNRDQP